MELGSLNRNVDTVHTAVSSCLRSGKDTTTTANTALNLANTSSLPQLRIPLWVIFQILLPLYDAKERSTSGVGRWAELGGYLARRFVVLNWTTNIPVMRRVKFVTTQTYYIYYLGVLRHSNIAEGLRKGEVRSFTNSPSSFSLNHNQLWPFNADEVLLERSNTQ